MSTFLKVMMAIGCGVLVFLFCEDFTSGRSSGKWITARARAETPVGVIRGLEVPTPSTVTPTTTTPTFTGPVIPLPVAIPGKVSVKSTDFTTPESWVQSQRARMGERTKLLLGAKLLMEKFIKEYRQGEVREVKRFLAEAPVVKGIVDRLIMEADESIFNLVTSTERLPFYEALFGLRARAIDLEFTIRTVKGDYEAAMATRKPAPTAAEKAAYLKKCAFKLYETKGRVRSVYMTEPGGTETYRTWDWNGKWEGDGLTRRSSSSVLTDEERYGAIETHHKALLARRAKKARKAVAPVGYEYPVKRGK